MLTSLPPFDCWIHENKNIKSMTNKQKELGLFIFLSIAKSVIHKSLLSRTASNRLETRDLKKQLFKAFLWFWWLAAKRMYVLMTTTLGMANWSSSSLWHIWRNGGEDGIGQTASTLETSVTPGETDTRLTIDRLEITLTPVSWI